MNILKVHRTIPHLKRIQVKHLSQVAVPVEDEYTETPVYPPILDMSLAHRKLRKRESIYNKIKEINTVEEKQIALNMRRYYGWQCVMFKENSIPYNVMPMVQCYTRSHFKLIDKLPDEYSETSPLADSVVKEIKHLIEDSIAIETENTEHDTTPYLIRDSVQEKEINLTKRIVKQINRIIMNNLSDKVSHMLSSQVDYDPRHEAFWFVGGVDIPSRVQKWRKQFRKLKENEYSPIDRPIQYIGHPLLTIRNTMPLKPIIPYEQVSNAEFNVQQYTTAPERVGYLAEFRHGTNIPGYWPGDYDEFGLLSYHGRAHITTREKSYGEEDNLEALHCQAMKASFGWLLAQANYQGFTTYNDITYPLVTQTVITNGQLLSLYVYQLNTIEMHDQKMKENPKHNICYGTKPLKLYETIENGKVKGLNEDALKMLVQFYLNEPQERKHEMKPFLNSEEQVVADIEDDKKRCWLEETFKRIISNRPRHYLTPEIYLWEKIYKIEHQTRFFERKRRPFELGINPFIRRLDDHLPPYIPKVLRPYPRCRKKFEDTYYPKV
ncbi:uncharacterized protein mRpS30 [Epargyreus clarus]|uniref:uncharacterized protein mRpS30 n=1 Tax=Epargyreus clarus TaxID=520877 RepID=UPI003C2ED40D